MFHEFHVVTIWAVRSVLLRYKNSTFRYALLSPRSFLIHCLSLFFTCSTTLLLSTSHFPLSTFLSLPLVFVLAPPMRVYDIPCMNMYDLPTLARWPYARHRHDKGPQTPSRRSRGRQLPPAHSIARNPTRSHFSYFSPPQQPTGHHANTTPATTPNRPIPRQFPPNPPTPTTTAPVPVATLPAHAPATATRNQRRHCGPLCARAHQGGPAHR